MSNEFILHPQLAKDCIEIAELPLCNILLCNDKAYPWFLLVPRIAHATDLYQLQWQEQQQILNESSLLSELIMEEFKGDKLNVAALGNMVPQLHIHHIVRFKTDISWPKPIWGQQALTPYTDQEIESIKQRIIPKLDIILAS